MKLITEFLGKPVLSLYEGNVEGYVKNIVFDKSFKKMKYIIIFEDNEFQDEKMLDVTKVYNYGDSALTIKNNSCLELKKEEALNISNHINCKVYTTLGSYKGIIADVEINETDFTIQNVILTNNQKLKPTDFFTFGQDIFFIQDENKVLKLSNVKKRENILAEEFKTSNILVSVQSENSQNVNPSTADSENASLENPQPKRYIFTNNSIPKRLMNNNSDFLLGRKTTKTIYSSSNEIIVRKNVNITEKIIKQAIMFNKLRELAIYSV